MAVFGRINGFLRFAGFMAFTVLFIGCANERPSQTAYRTTPVNLSRQIAQKPMPAATPTPQATQQSPDAQPSVAPSVAQPNSAIIAGKTQPQTIQQTSVQTAAPVLVTLKPGENLGELARATKGGALIDFYADWCGPCRKQSGVLHAMETTAKQHEASIIKVNVDEHPELAQRLQVSSLPTLMRVRDGKIIERRVGYANHKAVTSLLAQ